MNPAATDQRGFTLLELLTALMIIGVIIGMAALSAGGNNRRALLQEEARRIRALVDLAAREAILNQREFGLRLMPDGYTFQMLDDEKGWVAPPGDALLQARRLPAGIRLTLDVEGMPGDTDPLPSAPPQLIFFSSGEIIPFDLTLANADADLFRLSGDLTGALTLAAETVP